MFPRNRRCERQYDDLESKSVSGAGLPSEFVGDMDRYLVARINLSLYELGDSLRILLDIRFILRTE
jgi:hypothetical protein